MSPLPAATVAFNVSRQTTLVTNLKVADSHLSRLKGLIGKTEKNFRAGDGLWIVPCKGVHTLGMSVAIDVLYLDAQLHVIHQEIGLRPWRFARVMASAKSVLELPYGTIRTSGTQVGDSVKIANT